MLRRRLLQRGPDQGVVGASVARCPRDPALPCEAAGTWNCRSSHWLGSESNLTTVVVGSYTFGPSRRYHAGRKTSSFSDCRSWFAPSIRPGSDGNLVEAPGTAPGSSTPISCAVYRHSQAEAGTQNIGARSPNGNVPRKNPPARRNGVEARSASHPDAEWRLGAGRRDPSRGAPDRDRIPSERDRV